MVITRRGTDTEQASPNTSTDELSAADPPEAEEEDEDEEPISMPETDGRAVTNQNGSGSGSGSSHTSDNARGAPVVAAPASTLPSATATSSPVFAATPERIAAESALADSENEEDRVQERIEADLMHPDTERRQFRDLLVFEERLRQNAARLRRQQQRSEVLLGGLVLITAILGWFAIIQPSEDVYLRVLTKCLLAASVAAMIAICYSEPMTQASK
ncbi:hypothetical protein SYNPS1DRAFT_28964 [Syncephalis pseudoplumigaleata]|uniref:Transmembrane protein 188 n=1 Tax=Syncephalis pseudoplumigaleata TaxID=1712513 RepID=A0A4P9Z0S3_9FUNG|nr:hypothetical protein SYNPS1DRAFT_28964 [Syncephalis pseudoplumigaleata]|eukprot:RKP25301.1 hypothetical protein SYNPS1DRAFT_28964 [Syncephalis pseudoplumigaleata]